MRIRLLTRCTRFIAMSASICVGIPSALSQEGPLGQFESRTDVGAPKLVGSGSYAAAAQEYTVSGASTNMWFGRDQFHFVWKRLKGDFTLRTRVEPVGKGAVGHRKPGWMVRPTLEADAPYTDGAEHSDGLTSLQFCRSKGSKTEQTVLSVTNADVLQFERKGSTYIFSVARYGEPFVSSRIPDLDLNDEVYAGLFVCSHAGDVVETAVFRDVRIIRHVK